MNLKGRNKVSPEFNLSSMTDIVFLLLVFFMILTTVLKESTALDLVLPKAQGKSVQQKLVSVSIDEESNYFLNSFPIDENELENELKKSFEEDKRDEVPKFMINAHEDTPLKKVAFVMDIAVRNGYKGILATQK